MEERNSQSKEEKHVEFESQKLFPEPELSSDSFQKGDNEEKEVRNTDTPLIWKNLVMK